MLTFEIELSWKARRIAQRVSARAEREGVNAALSRFPGAVVRRVRCVDDGRRGDSRRESACGRWGR